MSMDHPTNSPDMYAGLTALTLLAFNLLILSYLWLDVHQPSLAKVWQRAASWTVIVLGTAATAFATIWLELPEGTCWLLSLVVGAVLGFLDPVKQLSGRFGNRETVKKPAYGLAFSYWSNHLEQVIDAAKGAYVLESGGERFDKSGGLELFVVDPRLLVAEISTGNVGSLIGVLAGSGAGATPARIEQFVLRDERGHYLYAVPPMDVRSSERPTLLSFPTGLSILRDYADHILPKDVKPERRNEVVLAEVDEFFQHLGDLLERGLGPRGIVVRRVVMASASRDAPHTFNFRVKETLGV